MGVSSFLIFLTRGGGGVQHNLTYMTKSKNHAKMPRFLLLFSKYDKFSQFVFSLNLYFSYFFLLSICVNNFHMHTSSLKGYFLLNKVIHQNLISDKGGRGGKLVSDFF